MKILVVDDMQGVRKYIGKILTEAGYEIEETSNGDEALRTYCERGPYDLVMTDLYHPGLNGIELVTAIHKWNPKQSIVFMSGFPMLEKPFRREQLLTIVAENTGNKNSPKTSSRRSNQR